MIPEYFHYQDGRAYRRAAWFASGLIAVVWLTLLGFAVLAVWGAALVWEAL